jgi:hypothetical protein
MRVYVKISDLIGYVGIARFGDVNAHFTTKEIDAVIGSTDVHTTLKELSHTNDLTSETIKYLGSLGWIQVTDLFKSNGDVHAFCFRKELK